MKKYIILSLIGIFAFSSVAVFAQTDAATTDNLGVENPGILPSSPFYFIKEWRRGITRVFTFGSEKKAELELEETNERAAEIKKMEEVSPQNTEALSKAIGKYQENTDRLKARLESLKETSENSNVDKLLDKLVDRSLQHQELFDNLREKLADKEEIKEQLKIAQEKIGEAVSKIPEKFENAEAFKERLGQKLEQKIEDVKENAEKGLNELRAVKNLELLKENLPAVQQKDIQDLKDKMIKKLEIRDSEALRKKEIEAGIATSTSEKNSSRTLNPIKAINNYLQEKREEVKERNKERICAQVITPAVSSDGACKEFPTPCEVPDGWKKVEKCELTPTASVLPTVVATSTGNAVPVSQ